METKLNMDSLKQMLVMRHEDIILLWKDDTETDSHKLLHVSHIDNLALINCSLRSTLC
jgi:hypothetical protein